MGYRKPGYYAKPAGFVLPWACDKLYELGGKDTWSSLLVKSLGGLGSKRRFVTDLSIETIWALPGEGAFANTPGNEGFRALLTVLTRFLAHLGVIESHPAIIGYSATPELSIDECLDEMLTPYMAFPGWDELGGEKAFTIEALLDVLPGIVRNLRFRAQMRPVMLGHLRTKLGDIAYKIGHGEPITQSERTFFCLYYLASPGEPLGLTALERDARATISYGVGPNQNMLVTRYFDEYSKAVQAGPYSRFARLISNCEPEQLVFLFGPQVSSLSHLLGYERRHGPFVEPVVSEAITLPWTEDDQLAAARESFTAFLMPGSTDFLTFAPIQFAMGMGPEYVPQYDEPDIMIRVDAEAGTLKEVEFSKMSKWRGRILTSANSLTPAGVLIDRALTDKSSGGAEVGELNMTAWKMIDMVGSKPFLGARAATEADLKEKILLPDAAGKTVKTYEIDMRGFYEKLGIITYPPAFAEYVMPPLSWLFQADEPVENYIATRANLTKEQRLQAIPTIRISHNWNKLRRLLSAKQLPVDFERMSKIAAATIGYVQ